MEKEFITDLCGENMAGKLERNFLWVDIGEELHIDSRIISSNIAIKENEFKNNL